MVVGLVGPNRWMVSRLPFYQFAMVLPRLCTTTPLYLPTTPLPSPPIPTCRTHLPRRLTTPTCACHQPVNVVRGYRASWFLHIAYAGLAACLGFSRLALLCTNALDLPRATYLRLLLPISHLHAPCTPQWVASLPSLPRRCHASRRIYCLPLPHYWFCWTPRCPLSKPHTRLVLATYWLPYAVLTFATPVRLWFIFTPGSTARVLLA